MDFAYAIHSDVGDHCIAVKINGEAAPLRTALHSGDVVEIVTAPGARPNPAWLNFVITGRARSRIRHYLKTMEVEESLALGEKLLSQAIRAEGLPLPPGDEAEGSENAALWQALLRWSGLRRRDELMTELGLGKKVPAIVAKRLAALMAERGIRPDTVTLSLGRYAADEGLPARPTVMIDGSEGATMRLATCCRPVPGDAIVGYLGRGEGLMVHDAECSVGRRQLGRDSEAWITVEWAEPPARPFETAISLLLKNGKGVLAQVATAVSGAEADIVHIDMGEEHASETTELRLLLAVRDRVHLEDVLRALRRAPPVLRALRVRP